MAGTGLGSMPVGCFFSIAISCGPGGRAGGPGGARARDSRARDWRAGGELARDWRASGGKNIGPARGGQHKSGRRTEEAKKKVWFRFGFGLIPASFVFVHLHRFHAVGL